MNEGNSGTFPGKVSVIVRCFNEERQIGNLMSAILDQTLRDREIIVVDSGSTDRTLEVVSAYPVKVVQITPGEFTFGRSLNRGCQVASGEYLVIASAHVLPKREDWLEQLIRPFSDPEVALVYGRQVGNERTRFSEHQIFAKQFPEHSNGRQETPFCNNANAAVRKALWLRHPYDESLTGLEDVEWAKWALSHGYKIVYNAQAEIIHIHEETPRQIFNRYKREAIALKHIFPDTHLSFLEFLSLWITNSIYDLLRAAKRSALFKNFFDILMFRAMQYWGTYRGINGRTPLTREMIMQFYYPRRFRVFQKLKKKRAVSKSFFPRLPWEKS